jgi:NTP pyrophosphatase (non-canonical NTP hydrolase)
MYPIMSLMAEAAEFADPFIKRDLRGDNKEIARKDIVSEAGDILWNLANALHDQGITLQEAADYNLEKLASRQKRGVIRGDGGDR